MEIFLLSGLLNKIQKISFTLKDTFWYLFNTKQALFQIWGSISLYFSIYKITKFQWTVLQSEDFQTFFCITCQNNSIFLLTLRWRAVHRVYIILKFTFGGIHKWYGHLFIYLPVHMICECLLTTMLGQVHTYLILILYKYIYVCSTEDLLSYSQKYHIIFKSPKNEFCRNLFFGDFIFLYFQFSQSVCTLISLC